MIIVLFFTLFFSSASNASKNFVIEMKSFSTKASKMEFPVKNKENKDIKIWTSESGIECTFGPWTHSETATLECIGPKNYKVQTVINCKIHSNKSKKAYLYVGIVGKKGGHRSFYGYCK